MDSRISNSFRVAAHILLGVSWSAVVISMFGPLTTGTGSFLSKMPMFEVFMNIVVAMQMNPNAGLLLIPILFFALAPVLISQPGGLFYRIFLRLFSFVLLTPWVLLVVAPFVMGSQERIGWGILLLTLGFTLGFFAIWMHPGRRRSDIPIANLASPLLPREGREYQRALNLRLPLNDYIEP